MSKYKSNGSTKKTKNVTTVAVQPGSAVVKDCTFSEQSVSAATLRSKNLKDKHRPEKPKPPKLFKDGQLVSITNKPKSFGSTNGRIVGSEWGGDIRGGPDTWLYWVKEEGASIGGEWIQVPEDRLGQIT